MLDSRPAAVEIDDTAAQASPAWELQRVSAGTPDAVNVPRLVELFRTEWDPEGKGQVDRKCLVELLRRLSQSETDAESLLTAAGVPGDGPVAYQEFLWWIYGVAVGSCARPLAPGPPAVQQSSPLPERGTEQPSLRTTTSGRRCKRAALLDRNTVGGYIGSYGKLMVFFRACRENNVTTPAQHLELMKAVDDISSHTTQGGLVDSSSMLFAGSGDEFRQVFSAFDIGTPASPSKGRTAFSTREGAETEVTADIEFALLWSAPGFDCHTRCDLQADLCALVYGFSAPFDLIERYSIDVNIMRGWIEAVAALYLPNPYHNWQHAVDVYQFCYLSLTQGDDPAVRGSSFLNYQDMLALLVASIAHDVGHPATNNGFLVNTSDALAVTYNDKSPLENMHASIAFKTLFRPGMNFLQGTKFTVFREKIVTMILATDPCHHFELVDLLDNRMAASEEIPWDNQTKDDRERQRATKADRRLLLQALIHMADIGNCCRPWDVNRRMIVNLEAEFFAQGDKERELGVPILPLMDRNKDSLGAAQGFWIEKFVGPLLNPFCRFISPQLGAAFQAHSANNKQRWTDLIEKHGKKTASELVALEDGLFYASELSVDPDDALP